MPELKVFICTMSIGCDYIEEEYYVACCETSSIALKMALEQEPESASSDWTISELDQSKVGIINIGSSEWLS